MLYELRGYFYKDKPFIFPFVCPIERFFYIRGMYKLSRISVRLSYYYIKLGKLCH